MNKTKPKFTRLMRFALQAAMIKSASNLIAHQEVGEFVPSDIDSSYEVVEQLVEVGMFYRGGTSLHRLYGFAPHPRLIAEALGNRLAIKANEAARRAEWELDEYGA